MCDLDQDLQGYGRGPFESYDEWVLRRKRQSNEAYEDHKKRLSERKIALDKELVRQIERTQLRDTIVTVDNFFKATIGTFDEIHEIPSGFTKIYDSKSSKYYTNDSKTKIIRVSDHWGWGIRFCVWFLRGYPQTSARKWIKTHGPKMKIGVIEIRHLRIHKKNQIKAIEWYNKRATELLTSL